MLDGTAGPLMSCPSHRPRPKVRFAIVDCATEKAKPQLSGKSTMQELVCATHVPACDSGVADLLPRPIDTPQSCSGAGFRLGL